MSWTDERCERLRQLWQEGLSCTQIANRLGGCTRNAVIGKVSRLGLPPRGNSPAQSRAGGRKAAAAYRAKRPAKASKTSFNDFVFRAPRRSSALAPDAPPVKPNPAHDIARKTLAALGNDECKWPTGDPGEPGFGFCALPQIPGLSYCEHHAHRAYLAPNAKTPRTVAPVEASNLSSVKQKEFQTAE